MQKPNVFCFHFCFPCVAKTKIQAAIYAISATVRGKSDSVSFKMLTFPEETGGESWRYWPAAEKRNKGRLRLFCPDHLSASLERARPDWGVACRDSTNTTPERPAQARAQNKGRRTSVVRSTVAFSQGLAPAVATAPLSASTQDRLSGPAFFSKGNEILAAPIRSGIETTGFERTVTSVCAKRFEKGDGPATWR